MPILYLAMAFLSGRLTKRAHEQADKLQTALKYVTSAIRHIETVKYFNGEWFELRRYAGAIALAGSLYKRQARFRSALIGLMQFYIRVLVRQLPGYIREGKLGRRSHYILDCFDGSTIHC